MYQGIGLDAFNAWPERRAAYALYECANSLRLSRELARRRPYPDHTALFLQADALLFAMPEAEIDEILEAYPEVVADHVHNDLETERKVVRNELARVNRSRLERMLGPEGGYQNW